MARPLLGVTRFGGVVAASGVVGAVGGVDARAHEEKSRSGSGRALPPRFFRPRPKTFGRSAIEAFTANRPKEKYPRHARCGRAAVRQAAECFCRGLLFAVGVRSASLRSHRVSLPLSPPSLRSCPPFAPFGRCPGAVCAPSRGGVCMPLSLPSLRSGSGGSLLAPLLPAQGRARPWANVARPPSPLSARGGDGAGLCVSLLPVLCAPSPKSMLLWLGPRNAEKAGLPSCPARLRPTSALRPQVWGFLLFSGGWRSRHVPYSSHLSCAATPTTRFSLLRARARNGRFGPQKMLVGGCRSRTRACDLMLHWLSGVCILFLEKPPPVCIFVPDSITSSS